MYSMLALALAGALIGACVGQRLEKKAIALLIGGAVGTFLGGFVGMFLALIVGNWVPMHNVEYGPATLVAVNSSNGMTGTFVWGSGSVNSQTSYNFMKRNDDGSLTPGQIPANDYVRIIEDKDLKDVGYWMSTYREVDTSSALYNWSLAAEDRNKLVKQELRVPAGTVVQGFSIK
jgi:hypothetical protein